MGKEVATPMTDRAAGSDQAANHQAAEAATRRLLAEAEVKFHKSNVGSSIESVKEVGSVYTIAITGLDTTSAITVARDDVASAMALALAGPDLYGSIQDKRAFGNRAVIAGGILEGAARAGGKEWSHNPSKAIAEGAGDFVIGAGWMVGTEVMPVATVTAAWIGSSVAGVQMLHSLREGKKVKTLSEMYRDAGKLDGPTALQQARKAGDLVGADVYHAGYAFLTTGFSTKIGADLRAHAGGNLEAATVQGMKELAQRTFSALPKLPTLPNWVDAVRGGLQLAPTGALAALDKLPEPGIKIGFLKTWTKSDLAKPEVSAPPGFPRVDIPIHNIPAANPEWIVPPPIRMDIPICRPKAHEVALIQRMMDERVTQVTTEKARESAEHAAKQFDKSLLADRIRTMFGKDEIVKSIEQLTTGSANDNYHFKAICESGQIYGMKRATRFDDGVAKEKLMADLAMRLKAPNATPTIEMPGLKSIDRHKGSTVNITPWLQDAKTLQELNAVDKAAINSQVGRNSFFAQAGEWFAFGTLFGLDDRHGGNWVWRKETNQLLMIDLEDCFHRYSTNIQDHARFKSLYSEKPGVRKEQLNWFAAGYQNMINKYRYAKQDVDQMLEKHHFAGTARVSEDVNADLREYLSRLE